MPVTVEGWDRPGVPAPDAHAAPVGAGAGAADAVRLAGLGARPAPSGSSASATGIEIYTPRRSACTATTCCPSCSATRLVARVDLKADRAAGALLVQGAFAEPGHATRRDGRGAGGRARAMAGWLGLGRVRVVDRGDLAPALAAAVLAAPAVG